MCGIIGVISTAKNGLSYKDVTIFQQLLYADTLRGVDATGVMCIDIDGNLDILKEASSGPKFIASTDWKDFKQQANSHGQVLFGHNRSATKGDSTNDEYAHPFIEGDICLLHNGTLHSHKHLADVVVDSHAICHAINDKGYKAALPDVNGAFALIWYNAKEKKLYVTRNNQRPLHFAQVGNSIYFASEGAMLDWILRRNDVVGTICSVKTDALFVFDMDTHTMEEEAFPKKVFPVVQHKSNKNSYHSGTGYRGDAKYNWGALYSCGDKITFKFSHLTYIDSQITLHGFTDDLEKVKINLNEKSDKELLNRLENSPLDEDVILRGTVSTIYQYSKEQMIVYHVRNVKEVPPAVVWYSENNIPVASTELQTHGGQCKCCNGFIETKTDEDLKHAYVKFKKGVISKLICGDCLTEMRKQFPEYGKGKKYESVQTSSNHSVQVGKQECEELEDLTPIDAIRASISC